MLNELTKEQEELCEIVFKEYDSVLDTMPRQVKMPDVTAWLTRVYSFYDKPLPARIEVASSPQAAFKLASELTGTTINSLDWCGISDAGWVSFYDYFHRIGVLSDDEAKDVLLLREFQRSIWDTVLLDECAIVVQHPTLLKRDRDGNLHSSTGPCIAWADGRQDFAWHGVWVPEKIITNPKGYTREEYDQIDSTEVRRALGEAAGWDFVVNLLGATSISTWTDANTSLTYELYRSPDGLQWIKKQSPALQNNQQPYYFEPVHENLRTARAARKWQATRLTPEECEKDPVLVYGQET